MAVNKLPILAAHFCDTPDVDRHLRSRRLLFRGAVVAASLIVLGVLIWQGVTAQGNPDPTAENLSPAAVIVDTGILVFREGLEAILVLVALTASLVKTEKGYGKPVALGAGFSLLATVATWFIVVRLLSTINAPALHIQAATGLLAIAVLLVIMNWFFHKVYWTGWITHHNRRKQNLTRSEDKTRSAIFRGLVLLGFTAVYREGFEIVLFLQSMWLRAGSQVVGYGVLIGMALTGLVAFLTFVAHHRLPYKRMLVLTGVMLGAVLLVMVGESVQECQQAGWCGTTSLPFTLPDWMGTWFAVFANVQSLGAQALAAFFVVGSYYMARRICFRQMTETSASPTSSASTSVCVLPDCEGCELHQQAE